MSFILSSVREHLSVHSTGAMRTARPCAAAADDDHCDDAAVHCGCGCGGECQRRTIRAPFSDVDSILQGSATGSQPYTNASVRLFSPESLVAFSVSAGYDADVFELCTPSAALLLSARFMHSISCKTVQQFLVSFMPYIPRLQLDNCLQYQTCDFIV